MKGLLIGLLCMAYAVPSLAAKKVIYADPKTPAYKVVLPGTEPTPHNVPVANGNPQNRPQRDDVIGDVFPAGNTWYDYQSNGSIGKMIAYDSQGGIHVTWMDGQDSQNQTRHQKYNYFVDGAFAWEDGVQVLNATKEGYGTIDIMPGEGEEERAVVFCHAEGLAEEVQSTMNVDWSRGAGAFVTYLLPRYADATVIWPQGVISPERRVHVLYNKRQSELISYASAVFNDEATQWPERPTPIDSTDLNTYRITASPHSEKVAITWIRSRCGIPAPPEWDGFLAYQMNNDLFLRVSDDEGNFDFDTPPINVTNCIATNADLEDSLKQFGDTLRPFITHDVIFDRNDKVHIVFDARGLCEKPTYDPEVDKPPINWLTIDANYIFHWSEDDTIMTMVADGWYSQAVANEAGEVILRPEPGAWKSNVCQMSLAYGGGDTLFCVYNNYPYGDYNDYVDGRGRCNGDISVTMSPNNGLDWYYPTPVVLTNTPNAAPGDAACEEYPSIAERVDSCLHIFYEVDREAGSFVQDDGTTNTLNQFIYQRIPVSSIATDSLLPAKTFHVRMSPRPRESVEENAYTPDGFRLNAAYPNPFNNTTQITYDLDRAQEISLAIYSLDGRLVKQLFDGQALRGSHSVSFNADGIPAGLYLAKLTGGSSTAAIKVTLLK